MLDVKSLEGVAAPGGAWLLEAAGSSNFCLLRLLLRWNPRGIVYSKGGFRRGREAHDESVVFRAVWVWFGGIGGCSASMLVGFVFLAAEAELRFVSRPVPYWW